MGCALGSSCTNNSLPVARCGGNGAKQGDEPCTPAATASSMLLGPKTGDDSPVWLSLRKRNSENQNFLLICESETEYEVCPCDAPADSAVSQVPGAAKEKHPTPFAVHQIQWAAAVPP